MKSSDALKEALQSLESYNGYVCVFVKKAKFGEGLTTKVYQDLTYRFGDGTIVEYLNRNLKQFFHNTHYKSPTAFIEYTRKLRVEWVKNLIKYYEFRGD